MAQSDLPILFDPRPRFTRFTVDMDLTEHSLNTGMTLLQQMLQSRGLTSRDPEWSDVTLLCSRVYFPFADKFKEMMPGISITYLPAAILKTDFTWGVMIGVDAVISCPSS